MNIENNIKKLLTKTNKNNRVLYEVFIFISDNKKIEDPINIITEKIQKVIGK
jgi:hypothetical protein